jgi:hypothetical protein
MQNIGSVTYEKNSVRDLNGRIEEVGWALFLMMIGIIWFLPEGVIPPDSWLVGSGLIMLGINFIRYFSGLKMSGFTVFLGILALVAGLSGILAVKLPVFAALFVIFGASLLLRALFKK